MRILALITIVLALSALQLEARQAKGTHRNPRVVSNIAAINARGMWPGPKPDTRGMEKGLVPAGTKGLWTESWSLGVCTGDLLTDEYAMKKVVYEDDACRIWQVGQWTRCGNPGGGRYPEYKPRIVSSAPQPAASQPPSDEDIGEVWQQSDNASVAPQAGREVNDSYWAQRDQKELSDLSVGVGAVEDEEDFSRKKKEECDIRKMPDEPKWKQVEKIGGVGHN